MASPPLTKKVMQWRSEPSWRTIAVIWLLVLLMLLAGCRAENASQADRRILFDKEGCAFMVRPNIGDTSFVLRLNDADLSGCKLK